MAEDINAKYDLVYILKPNEKNWDLRYSLRSVEKFCNYRHIWFVGYKPSWAQNVNFISTIQNQGKYKNSIINIKAACYNKEITDNFILMNDDFFAIKPIENWDINLNVCLGNLSEYVEKYKNEIKKSKWKQGFDHIVNLLKDIKCENSYNYETHLPIIINKQNFLKAINLPIIVRFMNSEHVLHKRSLYKNLYPDETLPSPRKIEDVKLTLNYDLSDKWLSESWLSVYDNMVKNSIYPKLNKFLEDNFPNRSTYETY